MEETWYIYIIETEKNKLYTGIAKDPEKRFYQHLFDAKKGAKFFRSDTPEKFVYLEVRLSKSDALKRELAIKKLHRSAKLELIQKFLGK
jgi:putative endonuclease